MAYQLLKPIADAAVSESYACAGGRVPVTFSCSPPLVGVETGTIQYSTDQGVTFYDLVVGGVTQQVSAGDTMVTVYGTGIYRVNKSASATASDVSISTTESP